MGGGWVYALRFVGSASLASRRCASALTFLLRPAGSFGGLSLRSGVCPAVPASGLGRPLVSSAFAPLPCGLPSPDVDLPARSELRADGRRAVRWSCWRSGGDAVSGVTPLRAGSLQVPRVLPGLPGTLWQSVGSELLS